jgi:S1-C subfamily serine protease
MNASLLRRLLLTFAVVSLAAGSQKTSLAQESYVGTAEAVAKLGAPVDIKSYRSTLSPHAVMRSASMIESDDFPLKSAIDALRGLQPDKGPMTRSIRDAALYRRVSPSVVLIVTDKALGSGSLLTRDGRIITNWHVVKGAKDVGVIFKPTHEGAQPSGADVRRAHVLKYDEVSDLALLKVNDVPSNIVPITLGDESDIAVGLDAHAIGHPTGDAWTYTKGVISQFRLHFQWSAEDSAVKHLADVIQTQTPINPGNSGGPLFVDSGAMIGVNSFQESGTQGLNFAVSVEDVKAFLARHGSRHAVSSQGAGTSPRTPACKPKEIYRGRNKLGDGDVVAMDLDCSGRVNAEYRTPYDTSKPIVFVVDRNHDSRPDIVIFDTNRDGKWDFSVWDNDFDGKWDLIGIHEDGGPKPTRFVVYDPSYPILAGRR